MKVRIAIVIIIIRQPLCPVVGQRHQHQARSQDFERGGFIFGLTQSFAAGGRCKPPSGVRGGAPEANAFWQTKS